MEKKKELKIKRNLVNLLQSTEDDSFEENLLRNQLEDSFKKQDNQDTTLFKFQQYREKDKQQEQKQIFNKQDILKRFDIGYEPSAINFRQKQEQQISKFIDEALKNRIKCRILLLTGMPGAGKSSLARKVLESRNGIKTILMTASTSISMSQFAMQLSYQIMGSRLRLHQLITYLEKRKAFEKIFIVIDEFDSLFKNQFAESLEIFKVFSFPIQGVSLIATSNSIQLMQTLSTKFNLTLPTFKNIVFSQYKIEQIRSLILDRANDVKTNVKFDLQFEELTLKYCATKIYNYKGGDIRFMLQQIKQIVANSLKTNSEKSKCTVIFENACSVLTKFNKSHQLSDIMKNLPFLQALTLISLYKLFQNNQILQATVLMISKMIQQIQSILKINKSNYYVIDILRYLEVYQFVAIRQRKKTLFVSLKTSSTIIKNAYEDDPLLGRYFWE